VEGALASAELARQLVRSSLANLNILGLADAGPNDGNEEVRGEHAQAMQCANCFISEKRGSLWWQRVRSSGLAKPIFSASKGMGRLAATRH